MTQKFELKKLHAESIPSAIEKAERYRLLNEPEQAESICVDVLKLEPEHQGALKILLLSCTDQFESRTPKAARNRAKKALEKLNDEYLRVYYTGLIAEREGRAFLHRGLDRSFAYHSFVEAMDCYAKAEALSPAGNDDAILRWNTCARAIVHDKLEPRDDDHIEHELDSF